MSNTKRVKIEGEVPFDLGGFETIKARQELLASIGLISMPNIGLSLEWNTKDAYYEANEHGGRTLIYPFSLTGEEAFGMAFFEKFIENVQEVGGRIDFAQVWDMELDNVPVLIMEYMVLQRRR